MTDSPAMQQAFQAFQEELDQATTVVRSRFEDMRLSGLLDASGDVLKHLPGRHDQQRHDPTKGAGIKSVDELGQRFTELLSTMDRFPKLDEADDDTLPRGRTNVDIVNRREELIAQSSVMDEDPLLRDMVFDAKEYTEGYYGPFVSAGRAAATGKADDWAANERAQEELGWKKYIEEVHKPGSVPERFYHDLGDVSRPYMREGRTTARVMRSAVGMNRAIINSDTIKKKLYRGTTVKVDRLDEFIAKHKTGAEISIGGPTSFSTKAAVARTFARGGKVGGAAMSKPEKSQKPLVIEVEPGAKGLNVDVVSPWRQEEILTQGRFVVKDLDTSGNIMKLRVQQIDVPEQELPKWAQW